ncbi:MbcA/ParS/Xre antitoxin family protein [Salinarimonas ramus]|uniref:Antitoxin Xre/MbcA/ParS-like toxin-binding domain-containing protein n=1 Tax=Salinarimonas ramus TaxID=690164 RepID=A0A917QD91_9HYPH|nr:MbcA/ParS/Xre antitoxin family protein [Salinarimonas ramus]GGK45136.1 hypothetical protein GCM10011322_35380 [Salinarimonas ramus]
MSAPSLEPDRATAGPQRVNPALFDRAERRRLSGPGLRTFLSICDVWRLTEAERLRILGAPGRSTYHDWAKAAREHRDLALSLDTLTRISAILGIYRALLILEGDDASSVRWLRSQHGAPVFAGRPPLELVTDGSLDALLTVRRFLDAARGGLYMPPNVVDEGFTPYEDDDIELS